MDIGTLVQILILIGMMIAPTELWHYLLLELFDCTTMVEFLRFTTAMDEN